MIVLAVEIDLDYQGEINLDCSTMEAILNAVQLAEVSWQPALGILSGPDQNTGDETTRLMSLPWESVRR